ncbi:MAG TPA: VWA domain-containing protein [Nocardioidaceae bacterium]|nr:VWA domain-containing protein [Nocardioidaceae bacterium]
MTSGPVLSGVDRAAFVTAFGERLRHAGVPVTVGAVTALVRALAVSPPPGRQDLYWLCRLTLVKAPQDLPAFGRVFAAVFGETVSEDNLADRPGTSQVRPREQDRAAAPPRSAGSGGLPWHTRSVAVAPADEDPDGQALPELLPSAVERVADTPFEELDEQQLALLGAWLERRLARWPTRRSRRREVHPSGARVALRATMARSRRTGFEPLRLSRHRPVQRPRTVTMVADVSASMQAYATAYLHLMRALARTGRAETFAFSTSLTRLTPTLRRASAAEAVAQASERVVDRYGGTHLAGCLGALLASRHGNALRGGVVVIASDGWDSDDPERLAAVMARLRRRARKVIWLNPRAASPGFAPLVGSMAAALPFCDAFLPAHTLRELAQVVDALATTADR